MNNDLHNILNHEDDGDRKKALSDLDAELNEQELSFPADDEFEKDAAEGLSHISKERIPLVVEQLNAGLRRQLKKTKKKRSSLPDQSFIYITVITVLILIVISYFVIKKMHRQ